MGFAFPFLLSRLPARFLSFGPCKVPSVLGGALVFRCAGFLERDGNGLPPALDLTASTRPAAF
jgi:hypothetical protein